MQKLNDAPQQVAASYAYPLKALQTSYYNISSSYQKNSTASIKSSLDALAYATVRMPATFGVIKHVLSKLPQNYAPASVLDLGCGTGSSMFACESIWPQNISALTCIDQNTYMIEVAQKLCMSNNLSNVTFQQTALNRAINQRANLGLLSYLLGELSHNALKNILTNCWQMIDDFLVVILPGTPKDFKILLEARTLIISLGGHILAPCPSNQECPMQNHPTDWCHLSERVERTKVHREIKLGTQAFEDEKFCYFIASKQAILKPWHGRIIKKPITRPGHIITDLCTNNGIKREIFGKKTLNLK